MERYSRCGEHDLEYGCIYKEKKVIIMPDLIDLNKKRIRRGGKDLWDFLKSLKKGDMVSAEKAMQITDTYAITHRDLVFFLSILDVNIEMEEFYKLILERLSRKTVQPIMKYDN